MKLKAPFMLLALLLSVATGLFAGCRMVCRYPLEQARTVSASELPSTVASAFNNKFPGATIVWVGAFGNGTNTAYSLEFAQSGKSLAVFVDTFGNLGEAYEAANHSR